ncbi:MAG: hypothetical protein AAFY03_13310, partial [Pseudomonadota bacterium]
MDPVARYEQDGFVVLPEDPLTRNWAEAARAAMGQILADPNVREAWLRCSGTWFAGVDVLPNRPDGSIEAVPLAGPAFDLISSLGLTQKQWHAAQVSITYPGYPKAREGESAAAARYRIK